MAVGPRKYFEGFGFGAQLLLSFCAIATDGNSNALINKQIKKDLNFITAFVCLFD